MIFASLRVRDLPLIKSLWILMAADLMILPTDLLQPSTKILSDLILLLFEVVLSAVLEVEELEEEANK